MIAGLFVVCGRDYVELCRHLGKDDEANRAQTYIENMVEAVKNMAGTVTGTCAPTITSATR